MAKVEVKDHESIDSALRRFKKQLQRDGTLQEARRKARFEKPSDKRRRERAARKRRLARRQARQDQRAGF
ncbi:MAG TPA: 30S ribosomal protein S21 [Armatimonadetes bacterium]|nr:30S ribosomal protein S21 [Armatimonadota bacterium]